MTLSQPAEEMMDSQMNGENNYASSNGTEAITTTITPIIDDAEELQHRSVLEKIGGFDLLSRRPLIGPRKNLLVVSNRSVRNYSYETGAFLNEFTFGKGRPIVAIQFASPQTAPNHLTVVSESGRILVWDIALNTKVDECFLRIGAACKVTTFHQTGEHYYFTVLRRENRTKKKVSQIFARHRAADATVLALNNADQVNPNGTDKSVAFGPGGRHCAALFRDHLYVYSIPPRIGAPTRAVHSMKSRAKKFTVVAYHPTDESVVVTGNNIGQIAIWSNVFEPQAVASRILHWHSQQVADLAFSPSGTFLYSVGAEKALVKWNLVGKFAGERSFLPRLGAAIVSVVVSEENKGDNIIVTSLADQTLAVIDGSNISNGIQREIEGLTVGFNEEGRFSAPTIAYCAQLQSLVLNGRVGHIQFYRPSTQRQLRQLDITEQNVISAINVQRLKDRLKGTEKGKEELTKIFPLEVTALAISEDCWMATVEYRDDGETMPEVRLKFWEMNSAKGHYHLNTTVHLPHTDRVNSIAFSRPIIQSEVDHQQHQPQLHLVTTSADRSFKIWDLNVTTAGKSDEDEKTSGRRWWSCSRTGSLNAYAVPRIAAFSADGSLLAVLFDQATLTLWELEAPDVLRYIPRLDLFEQPQTEEQQSIENFYEFPLPQPPHTHPEPLIFVDFAGDAYAHYLMTGTATTVIVRNVLKKFAPVFRFVNPELSNLKIKSGSSKNQIKAALAAHRWELMAYSGGEDNVLAMVSASGISFLSVSTGQLLMRHSFERAFGATFRGAIMAAAFTPEVPLPPAEANSFSLLPLRKSTFYCINEKHELFQLAAFDGARAFREEKGLSKISERERRNLYMQAVLRTNQQNQNQQNQIQNGELKGLAGSEVNRAKERKAIVDKFFYSVPSHVLPPVALYEKAYLASCMGLLKLTQVSEEEVE